MTRFAFEPIYESIAVVAVCCVVVVAVIALVTPPSENPQHRRWADCAAKFCGAGIALVGTSSFSYPNRPKAS